MLDLKLIKTRSVAATDKYRLYAS